MRTLDDLLEVMFGERIKITVQNGVSQLYGLRLLFGSQLGQQTLLQVGRGDAWRVKGFDLANDIRHLFVSDRYLLLKHQIIHQLFGGASQITVIVDIA